MRVNRLDVVSQQPAHGTLHVTAELTKGQAEPLPLLGNLEERAKRPDFEAVAIEFANPLQLVVRDHRAIAAK